jgi:hypothetical protein
MVREGKRVRGGSSGEQDLRQFIRGLKTGGREALEAPKALVALAAHVLDGVPAGRDLEPGDLVSALVERLLEARERQGGQALEVLLGTVSVRGVLRARLRQLASEHVPGRSLRKELAVHVRASLASPVPRGPARRPEALLVDGRYRAAHVRAAVAWALAEGAPREERGLVAFLLREYALGVTHVEADEAEAREDEGAVPADAAVLARELCTHLGAEGAQLVAGRLAGDTLQELCAKSGRKLTAVHSQVGRLEAQVADFVRASGAGVPQARGALRMLALAAAA